MKKTQNKLEVESKMKKKINCRFWFIDGSRAFML